MNNTGIRNTGNCNTGNWNTGNWNSGIRNTGYCNTGNRNTGNWNTGDRNTGYSNTGDWNSGNWNSGFFNTKTPDTILIFNKYCDKKIWDKVKKPNFLYFNLTEWIYITNMTDKEKVENQGCEIVGGYLKKYDYKEAFQNSFNSLDSEEKENQLKLLKALPNFDADIFYEISGIDVNKTDTKTIIIDDKEIEISIESYEILRKSLLKGE